MGEIFNKSYADYSSKAEAEKAFSSFKHRWYERLVIAKEIPANAFRLCYLLKPYFNLEYGGKAWPAQDTLAEQLTFNGRIVTRKTVNTLLKEVVRQGHLISQRGQHGCAYYMVLKEPAKDELRCNPAVTSEEADQELRCNPAVTSEELRCNPAVTSGDILENPDVTPGGSRCNASVTESSSTNFERRASKAGPGEREAADAAASGDLGPDGPPRRQGKKKGSHRTGKASHSAGYVIGTDPGFDEMRRNNSARPHADDIDEDYRAYGRALQLIDRDTLLANHKAYVKATVEGDGPKYLRSIAVWCNRHSWETPLPKPKRKSANGGGRHSNNGAGRRRGTGSASSIFAMAAQMKEKQLRRGK
jgi:hypothetical protein